MPVPLPFSANGSPFKQRKAGEDGKGILIDFIRLELSNLMDKGYRELFITAASSSSQESCRWVSFGNEAARISECYFYN